MQLMIKLVFFQLYLGQITFFSTRLRAKKKIFEQQKNNNFQSIVKKALRIYCLARSLLMNIEFVLTINKMFFTIKFEN